MPHRELKYPHQVENWLIELNSKLTPPGELILIGSGGLLWHAFQKGIDHPLPENSMDVDPISNSDEIIFQCYEAVIGSEFEAIHGWHVNLMPDFVLNDLPLGWQDRAAENHMGSFALQYPQRLTYWLQS